MRRLLTLLAALACTAAAGAVTVAPPQPKSGAPGDYVTLVFHMEGEGPVDVAITADSGATVLTPNRTVTLNGAAGVFVTVQVPDGARGGAQIAVGLTARADGKIVAHARSSIDVASVARPRLSVERDVTTLVGRSGEVRGYVSNDGNTPDRIRLRAVNAAWATSITPQSVQLAPGETAPVTVTVVPSGTISQGYRYVVRIQATSSTAPDEVATAQSIITFDDPRQEAIRRGGGLALVFGVKASARASATLESGAWSAAYDYAITPSLDGDLSDYVKGGVSTTPIHGDRADPISPPSSGTVALEAKDWSAGLTVSATSVGLDGGVNVGAWRVSLATGLSFGGGRLAVSGSAGLRNLEAAPDLDLTSSVFVSAGGHHEQFAARYTYHVSPALSITGDASVSGIHSAGTAGYFAIPSFALRGDYRGPIARAQGTYATIPTFGQHSASVNVSSAYAGGMGFDVSANGQLRPRGHSTSASVTAFGFPLPHTGLSGSLHFNEVAGRDDYASLTGAVQASTGFPLPLGGTGGVAGSYDHTMPLWGPAAAADEARLALGGGIGPVRAQLSGSFHERSASAERLASESVQGDANVTVTPVATTALSVRYSFTDFLMPEPEVKHVYGASWQQGWGAGVSSTLAYERTWDYVAGLPPTQPESLTATLQFANVLLPGLDVDVGYGITNAVGLLAFGNPYQHRFSVGIGYGIHVPFKTPQSVVQLFGGRKSGLLYGRALLRRDGSEEPLAGVTVALGDQRAVTGPDGSYELRVSPGVYTFQFPAGLAATLGLAGDPTATIVLDQHVQRDLTFEPVANVTITVFDDVNRNGRQDADEHGIPYAGVTLAGPVTRHARADDAGRAVASGVPAGEYTVTPDPRFLPAGYKATSEPLEVRVSPPMAPPPESVGAAKPPKSVVTTFKSGDVSIFGAVASGSVPAGADLTVKARTSGPVDAVELEMFGTTTPMAGGDGSWQATVRVPKGASAGIASGEVVANPGASDASSASIQVAVTKGRLFQAQPIAAVAGSPRAVAVQLLFEASSVTLTVDGEPFPLEAAGGHLWRGTVTLDHVGDAEAHVIADGVDLGALPVSVVKGGG